MCIICVKPAKVDLPNDAILKNMWDSNPDGAGMMYVKDGRVIIEKGFMSFEVFQTKLEAVKSRIDVVQTPMVLHFRIGTHGGNIPENTHPFPITDSIPALKKLKIEAPVGIAHNGIINIMPREKDISDTMEYIASQLAPLRRGVPDFYKNKHLMQMVKNAVESKMAFLTKDGEIFTIGDFIEDKGVLYSNTSYKVSRIPYRSMFSRSCYSYGYDWSYEDDAAGVEDLMPLDEAGMYVVDPQTGEFLDCEDTLFAINADGDVFQYFYDYDAYLPMWEYSAWTSAGTPPRFDKARAHAEVVLYETDGAWYDISNEDDDASESGNIGKNNNMKRKELKK